LLRILVLVVLTSCSGAARSPWSEARTVAEAHLRERYGEPPAWEIEKELTGTPFAFRVRGTKELVVLVHDHHVLAEAGLAAFDRYLRESGCIVAGTATTEEMMLLVQLFDVYPAHHDRQGAPAPLDYFRGPLAPAPLAPHLAYGGGGRATLTVNYRDRATGDGAVLDHPLVYQWVLAIDPVHAMTWTMHKRHWDPEGKRFDDVDHEP
jgi:hypothetical protein